MDDKNNQTPSGAPEVSPDAVITSDGSMQDAPVSIPVNTQPTAPQAVMDVTPPPHDAVVTNAPVVVEEPMPDLATEPVESSEVASAPAEAPAEVVEAPAAETPTEAQTSVPESQTNVSPAVVSPTGAEQPAAAVAVKKSGKGMMVAIAVVLALVLASAAILFYLRSKDSKQASNSDKKTTGTTAQSTAADTSETAGVTTADVDTASSDVDTSLSSINDTNDFSPDALSDASLGLQ